MHESSPKKGLEDAERVLGVNKKPTAPDDATLIIISMLMRIYDVQMALLSQQNKRVADEIYDAHSEGRDFNPALFVLEMIPSDGKDSK